MSALAALVAPLPILVAAVFLALLTGDHATVLVLSIPALAALALRRRIALSTPAQVLLLLGCGIAAAFVIALAPLGQGLASEPLRKAAPLLATGALLLAGLRLHLREPAFDLAGTFGAGLLVFLAGGSVRSGRLFPLALLVFAGLAFAALRLHGLAAGERQAGARLDRRRMLATGLLLALASGLAFSLSLAIPRLYASAYDWALRFVADRPVSGFHDGPLRLGALHGLLQSREIVARIEGDVGEHLRGNVYTIYQQGRWLPALDRSHEPVQAAAIVEPEPAAVAEIRYAAQDLDRFLLPVRAGRMQLRPRDVRVDRMGVVRLDDHARPERMRLLPGRTPAFAVAEPEPEDLALPHAIEGELRALAAAWTADASTDTLRIAALRARLESGYRYSLDVPALARPAPAGRAAQDPLLEFLLQDRAGHCEYFASAITLLARAAGIPARMVTGYRVAERNPWGDYQIVRELHAHAWSELYLAGSGWQTVDPSPLLGSSLAATERTPLLAGMLDYAFVFVEDWGMEALLLLLVTGLAAAQLGRILLARRGGRAEERADEATGPPAYLDALLRELAANGLPRAGAESLESLAQRARSEARRRGAARSGLLEAGILLRRYAALRYGGLGSPQDLERDVELWVGRARAPEAAG